MATNKHTRDWNELAELDAMWAVLSEPGRQHQNWTADEFFATGKEEIAKLFVDLVRLGLTHQFRSALDFGCGLGRLTRALRDHCPDVVGVDISQAMIDRAKRLSPDCQFEFNPYPDLRLFSSDSFDLIYCRRVLQHQSTQSQILVLVSEFVRVLKAGGVAAFQIPRHVPLRNRLQPRRRLYAALRVAGLRPELLYKLGLHPISMTSVPEVKVRTTVQRSNGIVSSVQVDTTSCPGIQSNFFYVTK
jgi:SAM-dependent methyltransferase